MKNDHVTINKQSKKFQKKFNNSKRNFWNLNPVTKVIPNKKAYNRKKLPKKFDSYLYC